jgi:hypothetical protein
VTAKASGWVTAVNAAVGAAPASVDVNFLGSTTPGVRYPAWYTPQVGDQVVIEYLGSQPYVSVAFF